jgi:N-acetylglutamate synthase
MIKNMNRKKTIIRKFCMEDYNDVVFLWNKAQLPYKPKGRDKRRSIEKEIKGKQSIFIVAEVHGKIIGSVFGTHDGRKGWINRLAVDPDFRRQGIARRLVADVEKRLRKLGIDIIAALIEDWNARSMKTFKRLGYEKHDDIVYFTKRSNNNV